MADFDELKEDAMAFPGQGAVWTRAEEKLLYQATGDGLSSGEIARIHKRTVSGIRARQVRLGLREARSKSLLDPLPPFQPFAREGKTLQPKIEGSRRSRKIDRASKRRKPTVTSAGAAEFAPNSPIVADLVAELRGTEDPIAIIWAAIQRDIVTFVATKKDSTMRARVQHIMLARLTPGDEYFPEATLDELGGRYGVTRERIRQIHETGLKTLNRYKPKCMLSGVLDRLLSERCDDEADEQRIWLGKELLNADCTQEFSSMVIRTWCEMQGRSSFEIEKFIGGLKFGARQLKRSARQEARLSAAYSSQSPARDRADAFVKHILSRAHYGGGRLAEGVDLSGMKPLRSCRGNREAYVKMLGRQVAFESSGERKLILALDRCRIIDQFAEQAVKVPYRDDGRDEIYIPDMIVRTTEGLVFVIEIKARPRLTDRLVQVKARAATKFLGAMGISYCLVDADGTSVEDIRKIEPAPELEVFLQQRLRDNGVAKFDDLWDFAGGPPGQHLTDQVQSLVLRRELDYRTALTPSLGEATGYRFDFEIRVTGCDSNPS